MRPLIFALLCGLALGYSSCVWPPDATQAPYPSYDATYQVHRISERDVNGTEHSYTVIAPVSESPYTYTDAILFIIVNGDTAYRHSNMLVPPIFDSTAHYYFGGRQNYITLVFHDLSISDSAQEYSLKADITWPPYGDTISKDSNGYFSFATDPVNATSMDITDSARSHFSGALGDNIGTFDVPASQMQFFQGKTLTADLNITETENSYYSDYYYYSRGFSTSRRLVFDRIVTYPMR